MELFDHFEQPSEFLGYSANGIAVHLNEKSTHAKTHLAHHPKLLTAVKRCLKEIKLDADIVRLEITADDEIGTCDLVETGPDDDIIYAIRVGRTTYSRFAKHRQSSPTSSFVVDIRRDSNTNNNYHLYTTFVGGLVPSFPGGDFMPDQSIEFWNNHALVYGTQEIIPHTETTICPWQ
jgi:hypothetical protein